MPLLGLAGHEVVARELLGAGVTDCFGLVGDDTISLTQLLVGEGVRYHPARHESAALSMADGYAWATGGLGVCLVTRGPGLTNTLTPARAIARAGRSVLVVTGAAPRGIDPLADVKDLDTGAVVRAVGLEYVEVTDPAAIAVSVRAAVVAALSGRPTVLAIADDVLAGRSGAAQLPYEPAASEPPPDRAPDDADLARIGELLAAAERPLIVAGRGAADAETSALLVALAERTGARLGTTALVKDQFLGHPHNLGVVGGFASDSAVEELGAIDCVLAFGAGLNQFTLGERTLFGDASIVQVDIDPAAIGRHTAVTHGVVASARATAQRLLDALPQAQRPALTEIGRPVYLGPDAETGDRLDPRRATAEIDAMLGERRSVVVDCGRFLGWPARFVPAGPGNFRLTVEFGAIGTGLGVALGVAAARAGTPTVLFVGDGGLSNLPGDLETAAHCGAPLLIVVLNDASYAAEYRIQRKRGLSTSLSELRDVQFADVARAYGLPAATARSFEELRALAPTIGALDSAFLIDCKIAELDVDSWRTWRS